MFSSELVWDNGKRQNAKQLQPLNGTLNVAPSIVPSLLCELSIDKERRDVQQKFPLAKCPES